MNNDSVMYLQDILQKYKSRDLTNYALPIFELRSFLRKWANTCYVEILESGSRAKGTAISLASDVDYLVSLTSNCNDNSGGLKSIFDTLYKELSSNYQNVRKQNVSIRINLNGLEVDVTPARKQAGYLNFHSLYKSKSGTWTQTNVQQHVNEISRSGRTSEIKLMKVWRELHFLEVPSIYLEYLIVNDILLKKPKDSTYLADNTWHVLKELARDFGNPLYSRIVDPANSANILSDLLSQTEKETIVSAATDSIQKINWNQILW